MKKIYFFIYFYFLLLVNAFAQKESNNFKCGVKDNEFQSAEYQKFFQTVNSAHFNANSRVKSSDMLECLVAVSIDKGMYEAYNKDKELIKNRVYEVFSNVSKIYEKELNIKLTVGYIEFWDSRSYTDIKDFKNYWLNISQSQVKRDFPHLFKMGYTDDGSAGISLRSFSSDFSYYSAASSSGFSQVNSAILTVAHEFGHNFSSPHTHSCLWEGGPIDACATIEGACMNNPNSTESRVGSIMSYCQNTSLTFHPLCISLIRSMAERILKTVINKAPNKPSIDSTYLALANTNLAPYLNWNYSSGANKYRIQIAADANFTSIKHDSSVAYNQFQAFGLNANTTYYWRVKAANSYGETAWSETATFNTKSANAGIPEAPILKYPADNAKDMGVVNFEFYPSAGATDYEVQIIDEGFSRDYDNPNNKNIKTTNTTINVNMFDANSYVFYTNNYMWRVRAKNENGYSDWSRYNHFTRNVKISSAFPKNGQTNVPTNLPFSWVLYETINNRKYVVELSTKQDFSSIATTKNLIFDEIGKIGLTSTTSGVANFSLEPNTTYYYRIKDSENANNIWANNSFKTITNDTISKKWKFLNEENSSIISTKGIGGVSFPTNSNAIWFGNVGLKFTDGVNWKSIGLLETKGLLKSSISDIASDSKGNVWIANGTQVAQYNGKDFTIYNSQNSNLRIVPYGMAVDKNDNVYTYCYENGLELFKFNGTSWEKTNSPFNASTIPMLISDLQGNIWSATSTGGQIAKLVDGNWTYYNYDKTKIAYFSKFFADREGNIWFSGSSNIAKLAKDGSWTYIARPTSISILQVADFAFDNANIPYFYAIDYTSKSKLYKYVNNEWVDLSVNSLPIEANNQPTKSIQFDAQNRLWFLTLLNGIYIFDIQGNTKSQTITAENITNKKVTAAPFDVKATATSGLPVSFALVSGPASISGSKITLTGQEGQVKLRAFQQGNNIFEPAPYVYLTFDVKIKDSQSITFNAIPTKALGEPAFALGATASSGLPITYTIVSGNATINNGLITITGVGPITVKASQAGNDDFAAATDITQTFCVTPAIPVITADANNPYLLKSSSTTTNQWYMNGNKIVGATNPSYLATQNNAKYKVEVINPASVCPNSFSKEYTLLVLANEKDFSNEVKVYPNPVSNIIHIQLLEGIAIKRLSVYSLSGNKVAENSDKSSMIEVSHLSNGVYLLEIETNKGTLQRKVIKE